MSVPPSSRRRRDGIHAELTALRGPGGPLVAPPGDLAAFFTDSAQREVVFEYREQRSDAPSDGRAVIVTAGPPGAGKSTIVDRVATDHRRIDPDEIKDLLLASAEGKGLLSVRHDHALRDGHPVSPRELSWWVHGIANDIADEVRRISLEAGENIVIEGTLKWGPLAEQYTDELANQDYESLVVLDVEVPVETAIEQARSRWWGGRTGADPLGGRFMADADVAAYYETSRVSSCATTARALYEDAQAAEIESELIVVSRSATGREYGVRLRPEGVTPFGSGGFSVPCLRCGHPLTAEASIARGIVLQERYAAAEHAEGQAHQGRVHGPTVVARVAQGAPRLGNGRPAANTPGCLTLNHSQAAPAPYRHVRTAPWRAHKAAPRPSESLQSPSETACRPHNRLSEPHEVPFGASAEPSGSFATVVAAFRN